MELKKTISTIFIVPTLKISRDVLRENGFINGYEYHEESDMRYENAVYLLFKPDNLHNFRAFLEEEYERTTNIIDDYDVENGFVVVVYKLNEEFKQDFNLIKQGKYSKTSEAFQQLFNKTTRLMKEGKPVDELSLQYRVFNKTQDIVNFWEEKIGITFRDDQEAWETYDKQREVLTTKKLNAYV